MLRLLVISLAGAVVLGLLAGGRFTNLAETRFRLGWVGLVGVALQFAPVSGGLGDLVLTSSFLCLFVVCLANRALPGFVLVLVGLWMNFLVITVNQGMPVTREAVIASGQADTLAELKALDSPKHHLKGPDDQLLILADIIGIGSPIHQAVSIGDLAALTGISWFVIGAMRRRAATAPSPGTERTLGFVAESHPAADDPVPAPMPAAQAT
jgi:hypothetical protein